MPEPRRSSVLSVLVAVTLLLLLPAPSSRGQGGVLADLPFVDPLAHEGPLYPGHVRIDLSPNPRRPLPMLLDTGAAETVMSPLYARSLRVAVRRQKSSYYRRSTTLGRDLQFRVDTRSSESGSRSGFEFGLIGSNFLREYVVEVDYQKQRVRFLDPEVWAVSEESAEPGEWILPMGLTDGRPTVEIALGSGAAAFLLDTGAPMDLMISEEQARELGIAIPEQAKRVAGINVVGRDVSASFFVPEVRVEGRVVENLVLNVTLASVSTYRVTNLAGQDEALLGNTFLSRFRVRFDYPGGRIGLLPVVTPPPPPEALPHLEAARRSPEPGELPPVASPPPPAAPVYVPVDLSPARAAVRYDEDVWIQVTSPADAWTHEDSVSWIEAKGWAGVGQRREHDLALVIDVSGSTAYASGSDIDGDGKVGKKSRMASEHWRTFRPSRLSSDSGDTVLAAELVAARRLIERLDPQTSRLGILSFASVAKLDAPVGSNQAGLDRALRRLEEGFGSGTTNMAAAIELATKALLEARPTEDDTRQQSILLLSDGYPTAPSDPEDAAYDAAQRAAEHGIRIYTFAVGLGDFAQDDIFPEVAFVSGGKHVRVADPARIVHELSRIRLTDIASVTVRNLSLDAPGRATRVFPDGSFDSLVPLEPGLNRIRIDAIGAAGGQKSVERNVTYVRPARIDSARIRAFKDKLEARTLETRLSIEATGPPDRPLEKQLDVQTE